MSGECVVDARGVVASLREARDWRALRQVLNGVAVAVPAVPGDDLLSLGQSLEHADPRQALGVASAASVVARRLGDPVGAARALWAKANALRGLGKSFRALSLYNRAAAMLQESGLEVEAARTRIGKIDALMYLGRYEEALAEAADAREILLRHHEALQAAKLDLNAGNIYHRLDRYAEALSLYDQARRVFAEQEAEQGAATLVALADVNRANVLTLLDEFRQAEDAYSQARSTLERQGRLATLAVVDSNLGFLSLSQGRYNQAIERLSRAEAAFTDLDIPKNAVAARLDLAEVYLALNLNEEAVDLGRRAHSLSTKLGLRLEAARALAVQAFANVSLEREALAADLLGRARQMFVDEGNDVWAATLDLHSATLLLRKQAPKCEVRRARELCRAASRVFETRGALAKRAYAQLVEGRLSESLGNVGEAARLYHDALNAGRRLHLPWLLYQVRHALGHLIERKSSYRARHHYLLAVEALEGMWQDLQPEELRTAFLANRLQSYESLVLLSLRDGPDGAHDAFGYVERAKSRALVDLLAGRLEARAKDEQNAELAGRLSALREELNWLYNRLNVGEPPGGRQRQAWVAELAGRVHDREVEVAQILRQLQLRGEELASLQSAAPCSPETVQGLLDEDTTLVEYYLVDGQYMAFVIDREGITTKVDLCSRDQVALLSERLRLQLGKFNYPPSYVEAHFAQLCSITNEHLGLFYDVLIRPIRQLLKGRKLVVVPHDLLHYLPFHACFDGERYLVEEFEVSYGPSSSVFALCQKRSSRPIDRVLVMGVPDERAPLVAEEASELGALFREPLVLVGEEATTEALRERGSSCDVVHIASHGVFSPTNPMFSRFRLADAWVNVHDVYNLELDASLVTLSACETGLSQVAGGDELIGLARGFFYAGASSLLLSLWAVNDASTAHLMRSFYRRLLKGESKAAALRGAQLEIKAEYIHPYYWAPFVLLGRPD